MICDGVATFGASGSPAAAAGVYVGWQLVEAEGHDLSTAVLGRKVKEVFGGAGATFTITLEENTALYRAFEGKSPPAVPDEPGEAVHGGNLCCGCCLRASPTTTTTTTTTTACRSCPPAHRALRPPPCLRTRHV